MSVKFGTALIAVALTACSARAADRPVPAEYGQQPIYAGPPAIVSVNPECIERRTRLLGCQSYIPVFPDDPQVIRIIDRPPVVRLRPYPEIFSW